MALMDTLKKIVRKIHAPKDYSGGYVKDGDTRTEIGRAMGKGAANNGSAGLGS